jgi:large subunit ribosomal protein L29
MKVKEIRDLTDDELRQRREETEKELFNLRMQQVMGQLEMPSRLRALRRDVARMKTIVNQRKSAAR